MIKRRKAIEKPKEDIYECQTCTGHHVYIVEVRVKEQGAAIHDKNGFMVYNNEWDTLRFNTVVEPSFDVQFPSGGDIFTPKGTSVLTYAQAMAAAWCCKAQDTDNRFEFRVRPLRLDYSWKIRKEDESKVILISGKSHE